MCSLILSFLIIFLTNSFLLAGETEITFLTKKEITAKPDVLLLNLSIEAKSDKEKNVLHALSIADKRIKNSKVNYESGNFYLNKNCFWNKNKRICQGFIGRINYVFKLKSPEDQDRILNALELQPKPYTYSINHMEWSISKTKKQKIENQLFSLIFDEILNRKKFIESKLNTICYIKKINFIKNYYPLNYSLKTFNENFKIEAPFPKKKALIFYKTAEVNINCQN